MGKELAKTFEVLFKDTKTITNEILEKAAARRDTQMVTTTSEITGIPTGFVDIDLQTNGLPYGISVAAARPEDGLTDFGLNVALNASKRGYKVAYISPEIKEKIIAKRVLMIDSRISPVMLREWKIQQEDRMRLMDSVYRLSNGCFNFYGGVKLNPEQFGKACQKLKEERGVSFIVLDRLQSLLSTESTSTGPTYYSRGREINSTLQDLLEEGLAFLVLCEAKKKGSEPICTDHLRDCGALEYGARPIIMFERTRGTNLNERAEHDGRVSVYVTNNLEGTLTFDLELTYLKNVGKFENYAQ